MSTPNPVLAFNVPATPGNGAQLDVSGLGRTKTVEVTRASQGEDIVFEVSNDGAGSWRPITPEFISPAPSGGQFITFDVNALLMRVVRVAAGATLPVVKVSSQDNPSSYVAISPAVPAGAGAGAGSDVTGQDANKTIVVSGAKDGEILNIEGSDDGGTTWQEIVQFLGNDFTGGDLPKNVEVYCQQVRVNRIAIGATAPTVTVTALPPGAGGGGGVIPPGAIIEDSCPPSGAPLFTVETGPCPGVPQGRLVVNGDGPAATTALTQIFAGGVGGDGSGVAAAGNGGSVDITGGVAGANGGGGGGSGGSITETAGNGSAANGASAGGAGGAVTVAAGVGGAGSAAAGGGAGGNVTIAAGDEGASGGFGGGGIFGGAGHVAITAGNGANRGTGAAGSPGGSVNLGGGNGGDGTIGGAAADGGAVNISGGASGQNNGGGAGKAGSVSITGGNGGNGAGSAGGDVSLDGGSTALGAASGAVKLGTGPGTDSVLVGTNTNKLGFFGAAGHTRPVASADATVSAAGATPANTETTYTGGTGASAYSVGGLVLALKQLGLIAS